MDVNLVDDHNAYGAPGDWAASVCGACHDATMRRGEQMVWPRSRQGPPPHPEMPPNVMLVYEEARRVYPASARSTAALPCGSPHRSTTRTAPTTRTAWTA
jgi:hypothetical protein